MNAFLMHLIQSQLSVWSSSSNIKTHTGKRLRKKSLKRRIRHVFKNFSRNYLLQLILLLFVMSSSFIFLYLIFTHWEQSA